jgi:sugar lactone lactonase YvrE
MRLFFFSGVAQCAKECRLAATGSAVTRRLINFPLGIGESPVWDEKSGVLWFVDIVAPRLYRFDAETSDVTCFEMPALLGSIALTSDRRILVALRTGVHLFDPQTQEMTFLVNPEPDVASNRLNDGKVGPDGAFWIGSMHMARPFESTGALYRVTADGKATRIVGDIAVSNGLAWSPDGRTMYHADSAKGWVKAYEFSVEAGTIANGRTLITLAAAEGIPDGAAVDSEGCYWSAGVSAGCLNRISPHGLIVERYPLPVAFPTMPCFGGRDGKTLYVTSMSATRGGVSAEGSLIAIDVGVCGAPIPRFVAGASIGAAASRSK